MRVGPELELRLYGSGLDLGVEARAAFLVLLLELGAGGRQLWVSLAEALWRRGQGSEGNAMGMAGIRTVDFEELSRQLEKRLGRLVGRRSTWCCPLTDLIGYVYISSKKIVVKSSVAIGAFDRGIELRNVGVASSRPAFIVGIVKGVESLTTNFPR